ncbi:hypothetical protein FS842_002683 [Serendipita sp. 407]|nr:hypothetical protein FS842_002683 [Serendipita sp. 407]
MGSSEYGPQYDAIRPGGLIVYVPLRTTQEHFNATENEVYYAVGDRESLLLTMISYRTWCHVTPAWPSKFDPMSLNSMIKLENVIQYFRASSFALASPAYNNTFARTSASDTTDSTPLPDVMERSPFRKCIEGVTENSLAIMNKPPLHKLSDILVFVFSSTFFFVAAILFYMLLAIFNLLLEIKKWLWSGPLSYLLRFKERLFPNPEIKRREMAAIETARGQELIYVRYP